MFASLTLCGPVLPKIRVSAGVETRGTALLPSVVDGRSVLGFVARPNWSATRGQLSLWFQSNARPATCAKPSQDRDFPFGQEFTKDDQSFTPRPQFDELR